ncbi:MAG: hypothetical protein IT382_17015 [Deltaproteobacteria bacterium]|nr:hypothetical protein [Deltaproteobacteria bacterium]
MPNLQTTRLGARAVSRATRVPLAQELQDLAADFLREMFSVPGERASVHPAMVSVQLADAALKRDPALQHALSPAEKAAPGYIATATVNVGEAQYRGVRVLLLQQGTNIAAKRVV